jgi:hypothetical protein
VLSIVHPVVTPQAGEATVTLSRFISKQRNLKIGSWTSLTLVQPPKTSVRPGHQLNVAQGLTDLQGNPIKVDTTYQSSSRTTVRSRVGLR